MGSSSPAATSQPGGFRFRPPEARYRGAPVFAAHFPFCHYAHVERKERPVTNLVKPKGSTPLRTLRVDSERWSAWTRAAETAGLSRREWIRDACDVAAGTPSPRARRAS